MKKILQVNFKLGRSDPKLTETVKALRAAPRFAPGVEIKGLLWKIWMRNEVENLDGGIYLSEDEASVEAYLRRQIFSGLKRMPAEPALR